MEDEKKSIKVSASNGEPKSGAINEENNGKIDDENSKNLSKKSESLESALRKFKKQSSGIISEIRKREAYDKPSVKRKKKSKEARKHKKMGRFGGGRW